MSDTHFIGFRDCCREAKAFLSEEARNEYEADPHPHDGVLPEPVDRYTQDQRGY